jgi:hypothetical protein
LTGEIHRDLSAADLALGRLNGSIFAALTQIGGIRALAGAVGAIS